jgi:L,D-transpeptidase-like protein
MQRFETQTERFQNALPQFGTVLLLAIFSLSASAVSAQSIPKLSDVPRPQPARRIVVSIPDRKLALLEDGRVVKIYDVAVGAHVSPSPNGEFQIVQRLTNPTYFKPGVVIGPGAGNPLGTRWLGLNIKGFGIHGTNRPASVGKNASHGCIRLKNSDMEDLFARVRAGDHVSLLHERTVEIAQIFGGKVPPTETSNDQSQVARAESVNTEDKARGSE